MGAGAVFRGKSFHKQWFEMTNAFSSAELSDDLESCETGPTVQTVLSGCRQTLCQRVWRNCGDMWISGTFVLLIFFILN